GRPSLERDRDAECLAGGAGGKGASCGIRGIDRGVRRRAGVADARRSIDVPAFHLRRFQTRGRSVLPGLLAHAWARDRRVTLLQHFWTTSKPRLPLRSRRAL